MPDVEREQYENSEATAFYEADLNLWNGRALITFSTNPEGQRKNNFRVIINPDEFDQLAKIMIHADPAIAIRAFGAAMQMVSEDA